MSAPEKTVNKKLRDEDELEFIRGVEINRRTKMIMKRDGVSETVARDMACEWILSETGQTQLNLPIDPINKNVYRVYYRRFQDDHYSDYRILDVVAKGVLYSWHSTNDVLADIIRDRFDDQCDHVVVFHLTQEHDHELSNIAKEQPSNDDEIARRRKIRELEKQLDELRNK